MKHFGIARSVSSIAAMVLTAACGDLVTSPAAEKTTVTRPGNANVAFLPGRVIVRYKQDVDREAVVKRVNGRTDKDLLLPRTQAIRVPVGQEAAAAAALSQDPRVEFAEVDELAVIVPCEVGQCQAANDAFNQSFKWDLHNPGVIQSNLPGVGLQNTGKGDADIDWVEMFDALGGNAYTGSAVIGILDTGIRPDHFEFAGGRIIAAQNFATGYPSDFLADRDGHGTHVAGIAAGQSDGRGVTGVAYGKNIKLISAKVCERYLFPDGVVRTSCPSSSQADAIIWATDHGANVLNLSLGGDPRATSGSQAVRDAMKYALSKNVLPVCAAGNDNFNGIAFPARFDECVTVGATNWGDARASYSNYGGDLEVVAPGGDANPSGSPASFILSASTAGVNSYRWLAGTSMATPQVVGLAAMIYASGVSDVNVVRQRLRESADDLGPPGYDAQSGYGRINAYRAITRQDPFAPPVAVADVAASGTEGLSVAFHGSQSYDPNNHPITRLWNFGDGGTSTAADPTHVFADNGSFAVTLTVTDESGHTGMAVTPTTVANALPVVTATITPNVWSGSVASFEGSFSDLGVNDAVWHWTLDWGNGTTSGSASTMGTITGSRRYCAVGTAPVTLTVTDKDEGSGFASAQVVVGANAMDVSMPPSFNTSSSGKLPVTIHGSNTLDVNTIDIGAVRVGGVGVEVKNNGQFHASIEDANGDGRPDLTVHVDRQQLVSTGAMAAGNTQVPVTARLTDGCKAFAGSSVVRVK